ncbi:MAG: RNA methyltransferase [Myxococcota bacterium]|nr:RNA methyltransferase [Myxococcota bacterium]
MSASDPRPGQTLAQDVVIVLVNPLFPGNVGATARAMANFGLRELVLVDPLAFDLERARWMATSGKPVLDACRIVGTLDEALEGVDLAIATTARKRRWRWPVYTPRSLGDRIFDAPGGRTAILFGREDFGLDNEAVARCQGILRIPTGPKASLNLGQAVLLTVSRLHESARDRGWRPEEEQEALEDGDTPHRLEVPKGSGPKPKKVAPLPLQNAAIQRALDVLERTAYGRGWSRELVQVTLSQVLQRAEPTPQEVQAMLGMLAKTAYAVENGPDER